ncbi:hypothetical protein [Anaerotignum propionicum]|uniref:hypothetical protein n=1 Tax=Anaerotignum propionicum TaxID=28446 RepID=UPI00289EC908|nr:hypothetical protein [Anaerotignum propionicum]
MNRTAMKIMGAVHGVIIFFSANKKCLKLFSLRAGLPIDRSGYRGKKIYKKGF